MDAGHEARKDPSDSADLDFQGIGPALRIMQLNVEGCQQRNAASSSHLQRRTHYAYEKKKIESKQKVETVFCLATCTRKC